MPSNPISLTEAIELVKDPENLGDPRLLAFMSSLDEMSTDILKDKSEDYLFGTVAFIQAVVSSAVLMDTIPHMNQITKAMWMMLLTDDSFAFICALAFKMSIGIATYEELR